MFKRKKEKKFNQENLSQRLSKMDSVSAKENKKEVQILFDQVEELRKQMQKNIQMVLKTVEQVKPTDCPNFIAHVPPTRIVNNSKWKKSKLNILLLVVILLLIVSLVVGLTVYFTLV